MVDTDWKEILSFSQRELTHTDKEKLCESLCWMEADDIELNFSDLKTLFRLAQDILKLKSEQVNNLVGQLKTTPRRSSKTRIESPYAASPTQSNNSALETITHQEEIIRANKEILEQLYADIADLESKKSKLEETKSIMDLNSDSSRDVLSEMNAVAELEREVTMKNKHIRRLLKDVKVLEDDNTKLKEKASILKEKLTEATQLINNFTEQIVTVNNECRQLKEMLGKTEQEKIQLSVEIEDLRKALNAKDSNRENVYVEIKSRLQHWKNIAKSKKAEVEALSSENLRLKEDLEQSLKASPPTIFSTEINNEEHLKEQSSIKELRDKLLEASTEIENTASIIETLRAENRHLKSVIEDVPELSVSENKNESDEGKERIMIKKLKKKVTLLTTSLQKAEEMIVVREKELAEITSQLQLLRSDEGINALLEGLKSKKRQLKFKEEGIKSLVVETNTLNQLINDLQIENESLRQKYNVPLEDKIPTKGVIKDYYHLKNMNTVLCKELKKLENKLIMEEINNRDLKSQISNLSTFLNKQGHSKTTIEGIAKADSEHKIKTLKEKSPTRVTEEKDTNMQTKITNDEEYYKKEMIDLIEENKGLRLGLQEILDFIKENDTASPDVLTLKCPSLEAVLVSMEARNSAGWFAPHMSTIMELRAAIGGKDALLIALQEARKDTLNVMTELSEATNKTSQLEEKLSEMEQLKRQKEDEEKLIESNNADGCEFGSWISENNQRNLDLYETSQIHSLIEKQNTFYECQLKKALEYFHNKFKDLFEKLTLMAIQTNDNCNKWSIQEEHLKAEIENLKGQLQQENDDFSDSSPGLIPTHNSIFLERKCLYLEEAYINIRTMNENMKNEILENKRNEMLAASDYEIQIQRLMLTVINLIEKLRSSVSYDLFWKQNVALNETNSKYRKLMEENISNKDACNILKHLEDDKLDILNRIRNECVENDTMSIQPPMGEANIEQTISEKQILRLTSEIDLKTKEIHKLQETVAELQETQGKLIDNNIATLTKDEENLLKEQIKTLNEDNKILKEKCQHVSSQLSIALTQLQDSQQRLVSHDIEINMLNHQILDLQSTSDNKAIIARLSGEILVAHLQSSEYQKKIESLSLSLSKEREAREETEEMLRTRQKIFDYYTLRHEKKFRYMYEVLQILRQQYQGCIPRDSIENYLNKIEDYNRKNHAVDEKLSEIEDLRSSFIAKHSIFDQILDISKSKCMVDEDSCPHKLKYIMMESINTRELEHKQKKINVLEQSREELTKHCNHLEKTLVLVNQGFEKYTSKDSLREKSEGNRIKPKGSADNNMELVDICSDAESSSSRRSKTITLSKAKILRQDETTTNPTSVIPNVKDTLIEIKPTSPKRSSTHTSVQTMETQKTNMQIQTDEQNVLLEMNAQVETLETNIDKKNKELSEAMTLIQSRSEEILNLNKEKIRLESTVKGLNDSNSHLSNINDKLRMTINELRKQLDELKIEQITESNKMKYSINEENKSLLVAIKQLENDKNTIASEYKGLLDSEREEYAKSVQELHLHVMELQSKLDRRGSESSVSSGEALKEVVTKYTMKTTELEDKCFKLQSELDDCKTALSTYQTEADRWKDLATERLTKMEQLSLQLEERHCHEVESYKAENQHWLSQLNDMQREHMELRTRLIDQKTGHIKQLTEKDTQIEQLKVVTNNLKTQIMNMQNLISVNDPSFDLSAIVEVEETSDVLSQHGSDRLELKFDSTVDLHESQDEIIRIPASSTTIWQEPVIERLRREKQLAGKQNAILRRQIKVLASRERRARLDAQNLRNQVFRISTSGNKVTTAETAALHNKISTLQAQLMSARRDTHSSIALWDKWKRAQQASDRWQARYEDRSQEVIKLEASLHLAKSAVRRLEKEKRILLSRLNEIKNETQLPLIEKQEAESPEKSHRSGKDSVCDTSPIPVSSQALLDRVQAQQRRITALEFAEKGNELLVSEYERALAEITSLKGQVLKLESTLLEAQIRMPLSSANDTQPELEYWKNYCEMLKEENVQLTQKVNSMEAVPTTAHQHRISDLEQTILTLRGVVNKLQSEQKLGSTYKRIDSRPSSSRSSVEKGRIQLDSHRIEIVNLKRTIHDKDLLLEKSKEMLKIAAEREEQLLRENAYLRRQLDELTKPKGGFLSD